MSLSGGEHPPQRYRFQYFFNFISRFQSGIDTDFNMVVRCQYGSSSYSAILSIFIIILFNYKTRILTSTLQKMCENVKETERSLSSYDYKGLYWFLSKIKEYDTILGQVALMDFYYNMIRNHCIPSVYR